MRKNLPSVDLFLGKTIRRFPDYVIAEHVASGNNGHLFRAFDQKTEGNLAFKVVPVENLPSDRGEQQVYLNEAKKANLLEHPAVVRYIDVFPNEEPGIPVPCVFFVRDYIKGQSLKDYIKSAAAEIGIPFIETFLETMFGMLYELQQRRMRHGDLHSGNVLVAVSEFAIDRKPTFRVTDFGVGDVTSETSHVSDFLQVAAILRQLLERVQYVDCGGRDRYVYGILRQEFLARHLIETDTSADPVAANPRELMNKLTTVDERYLRDKKYPALTLVSPFDYPNCEQIGNAHLLLRSLYSDRLLGLLEVKKRSNMILTGPRGCGKTTVFRALSLEYLMSTGEDDPKDLPYIGLYYRCDDLYFAFPRYERPEREEALDVPMHFMIVTLIAITLEQVGAWGNKYYRAEMERKEAALVRELWDLLEWKPPDDPTAPRLSSLVNRLRGKERRRAATKQRFVHVRGEPIEGYFGPGKLFEVCECIRKTLSFLRDRQFYFFIDDYSHPKITKALQANLNRLVMHRNPHVFFKLSTESPISFARDDVDGKQYVESREYDLLNLGLRYISSEPEQTLEFLEDVFARRFGQVENYPIRSLEELVGSSPRNENETARAFREERGRENYAGKETIAAICSGDIHYMIRLVGGMVEDFGGDGALGKATGTPRIPKRRQHRSIRAAAGTFMESVRTLPQHGQRLADVVSAFGNVARSYLLYETSSNQTGDPPHQASRIEPYEPLRLSSEAQGILEELLRYSVLIEDPRGKSRRGRIVPRFYLRRYLIPHFQLTFSRRDSLSLENADIELLLSDPQKFEDTWRVRSKNGHAGRRKTESGQGELFADEDVDN